jgi:hypothetical protein
VIKTDSKRGPGRPRLDVWPVKVTLRLEDLQTARALGDDEASRGLRRALQIARDLGSERERMERIAGIIWQRGTRFDRRVDWRSVGDILHGVSMAFESVDVIEDAAFLSNLAETRRELA